MRNDPDDSSIVCYMLTKDCERTVARAIASAFGVATHVLVVDSGSSDRTCDIAIEKGADVVVHEFQGFPAQRNWAIDQVTAAWRPTYILALDGDEWLDDELVRDIRARVASGTLDHDVYFIRRRVHFDGRTLHWGGFASTRLARLFRAGVARYEDRAVNEHLEVPTTATRGVLEGAIEHSDVQSWEEYVDKHNRYSTLEAQERTRGELGGSPALGVGTLLGRPDLRRRWLRERIWNRLPGRPALRFVQVYVALGGFLDGRAGFRRAVFEAWQEMCTDLKAEKLRSGGSRPDRR